MCSSDLNSKVGDVVLDPFGGTMTTGAVAKRMGRNYIMIEQNETYCKEGQKRLDKIRENIGDIELASFDVKPPRVTFQEMIQAGYFKVREKLFYAGQPYFFLMEDGKIIRENESPTDIHTAIARVRQSPSNRLNGWEYWLVMRDDKLVQINEIRQKYIQEVKSGQHNCV